MHTFSVLTLAHKNKPVHLLDRLSPLGISRRLCGLSYHTRHLVLSKLKSIALLEVRRYRKRLNRAFVDHAVKRALALNAKPPHRLINTNGVHISSPLGKRL